MSDCLVTGTADCGCPPLAQHADGCDGNHYPHDECNVDLADDEAVCERCGLPFEPHAAGRLAMSHCPGWKFRGDDFAPAVRPR